jgi:hypothetical protein
MNDILNLLGLIVVFLLGGGAFWLIGKNQSAPVELPKPPTKEELNKIRKDKENELRNQDPKTFIDNNIDNYDDVNDVKCTSDDEFDRIRDRHRRRKNVD